MLTHNVAVFLLVLALLADRNSSSLVSNWVSLSKKVATKALLPIVIASPLLINPLPSFAEFSPSPWNSDIKFEAVKSFPENATPSVGELVAVRFQGKYKGLTFDDTFKTEEPYFFRLN